MAFTDTSAVLTCDKILKGVLADKLLMEQLLRFYVFEEAYADEFDYETLRQLPTEHVDPSTCNYYFSDMIWQLSSRNTSRRPTLIVVLLEFQSTSVYPMALRMLNYTVQFYMGWVRNHRACDAYPLPQVMPVVLYTGFNVWTGPQDIQALLSECPEEIMKGTPALQFNFKLLNVSKLDLRGGDTSLIKPFMACLQMHGDMSDRPRWDHILGLLHNADRDAAYDCWAQLYMMMVLRNKEVESMNLVQLMERPYPNVTAEELEHIDEILDGLEANGEIVPLCARMRLEGIAEGHAEGRAEGHAEGRTEGLVAGTAITVANVIALRFAECPPHILDLIKDSNDKVFLDRVIRAVATANTLEEFLPRAGFA